MKRTKFYFASLIALLIALVFTAACSSPSANQPAPPAPDESKPAVDPAPQGNNAPDEVIPITIGAVLESSGENAAWGLPRAEALQIVQRQMEADGGFEVNGRKYRFVFDGTDNRGKPDEAVTIAKRLLDTQGYKIFYDGGNSGPSQPVCEYIKGRDILSLHLSTISQSYIGLEGYSNMFNTWKADGGPEGIASYMWPIIREQLPEAKTVAFIMLNNNLGQTLTPIYSEYAKANGFEVIDAQFYASGTVDHYQTLNDIYKKNPDILFVGNNDEDVSGLLKQALEIGFTKFASCRVNPGIPSERLTEIGDGYFFGVVDRDFTDEAEQQGAGIQRYLADYKAIFGKDPDLTILNRAVAAYEPMYALAKAMQQAGSVDDINAIAGALRGMKYEGDIWTIKFDERGQMTNDYYVYYVHGGQTSKNLVTPRD